LSEASFGRMKKEERQHKREDCCWSRQHCKEWRLNRRREERKRNDEEEQNKISKRVEGSSSKNKRGGSKGEQKTYEWWRSRCCPS
jgi:hypothetical protein